MEPKDALGSGSIRLFMCGDVMLGRGIDQVLQHPSEPSLYEPCVTDARDYVLFAEREHGPVPRRVSFAYVWGDALAVLEREHPDLRLINLETSVTAHDIPDWKGINYRMHPDNVGAINAAHIDCAVLANNHVLDWGEAGLTETLSTLRAAGIVTVGAGHTQDEAMAPAVFDLPQGCRARVHAFAAASSGVPPRWAAGEQRPGVCFLPDSSDPALRWVRACIERARPEAERRPGDVTVVSLHWGPNWGYEISDEQRHFAHRLIDEACVDVVYGHSSHHAKGIEVYRAKPIIYGCGDFINDYEGIAGYEQYRGDLSLMYFVDIDPVSRQLSSLRIVPLQLARFRLRRAEPADVAWIGGVLDREGARLGTRVQGDADGTLALGW